jgi:oligopeptide/dipeptide ABC transporter ATP-binding protein
MRMSDVPVLEVRHLKRYFAVGRSGLLGRSQHVLKAVDDASFTLREGETLGLVGESGSGKSTLGRSILRLIEPTSGQVLYRGNDIVRLRGEELRSLRRHLQMVFQDPYASLNPRMRVGAIIREPLDIFHIGAAAERKRTVTELLRRVGLDESFGARHPHQLSGGQRQRVGIAAALALGPSVIVADEPTSALDVSVQAQILNLLSRLQSELRLSLLFISHNLATVEHVSDHIAVMYLGKIVETASKRRLFTSPQHPYTKALLAAVPLPNPNVIQQRVAVTGEMPSPLNPPSGCPFHPRCPEAVDVCRQVVPALQEYAPGDSVACHVAADRLGLPGPIPIGAGRGDTPSAQPVSEADIAKQSRSSPSPTTT